MTHTSEPELLVLHALRLVGMAEGAAVASRFGLDRDLVQELLEDDEAYGWVERVGFAGLGGWALTESGAAEVERRLAVELDETGVRDTVESVHAAFAPLNARLLRAVTDWQIRPLPGNALAANEHDDPRWDDRVLDDLAAVGRRLEPLAAELVGVLARFDGYAARFGAAVGRAERGEHGWIDGLGLDSCHRVWFELHEDLLATLGLERGAAEPASG